MTEKLRTILLPAVFLGFWAVLLMLFFLLPDKDYSETEKRYLAAAPEMTASGLLDGTVQEALEDYTADQFPGRNLFTGISAYNDLLWGRNAAQDYYHCDGGYLIAAPKQVGDATFLSNLALFDAFAAQTGLPATLIAVPEAGAVLEDLLPAGYLDYRDGELIQTAKDTLRNITVLDVTDTLKSGNETAPVYYHTDHHLTAWGNYLVYRDYLTAQGRTPGTENDFTVTSYGGFYGTAWSGSGYWLTPADTVELWDRGTEVTVTISDAGNEDVVAASLFFLDHLAELDKYPVYLDGNHGLVKIENPASDGGTLLVVRDSYAHCLSTFLAGDYAEIYLIDLRYYRGCASQLAADCGADELLFLYGMENLRTDTNAAWLY